MAGPGAVFGLPAEIPQPRTALLNPTDDTKDT